MCCGTWWTFFYDGLIRNSITTRFDQCPDDFSVEMRQVDSKSINQSITRLQSQPSPNHTRTIPGPYHHYQTTRHKETIPIPYIVSTHNTPPRDAESEERVQITNKQGVGEGPIPLRFSRTHQQITQHIGTLNCNITTKNPDRHRIKKG